MRIFVFTCGLLLLLLLLAATAQAQEPGELCRAAIARAEQEHGIPPRLLAAIGRVESGRRDPSTGTVAPWPWAINAEARGSFLPDKAAAIAAVRVLQAQGVRSINIGCLQVNLRHHPAAFASLEEAFDPLANARYAARFLSTLQAAGRGDWMQAAAHYHSQTPHLAEAYRARVSAAWLAEQGRPAPVLAALTPSPPVPVIAPGGGAMLGNGADRAPMMPSVNGSARGLDAYLAAPIPRISAAAPVLAAAQRIGQEYIRPPSVQSRFSPRSSPIAVFGPR
jgi:hypothetical protein